MVISGRLIVHAPVDRPCVCPSVDQVGEDVSCDGVVVTGQEHPEVRAILDGRIQQGVAYTAEAEPCMHDRATHSIQAYFSERGDNTESSGQRDWEGGPAQTEHAGAATALNRHRARTAVHTWSVFLHDPSKAMDRAVDDTMVAGGK